MSRPSNALDRRVERFDRTHDHGPAIGLDHEGMPPIQHLASLEEQSRHRLSPRRQMWPELQKFEERLAELEGRHRDTIAALGVAKGKLRDVDRADAAALTRWEIDGRQGEKPAPEKPALLEHVAGLERDRDGLAGAIAEVLADKAAFVERHRDRLVAVAERMVEQAKARYLDAVAQIDAARAELVEVREASLWAQVFPDESASRMPEDDPPRAREVGRVSAGPRGSGVGGGRRDGVAAGGCGCGGGRRVADTARGRSNA